MNKTNRTKKSYTSQAPVNYRNSEIMEIPYEKTQNDWIDYIQSIEQDIFDAHDYFQSRPIKIPDAKYDWFKPSNKKLKIHWAEIDSEMLCIILDTIQRKWVGYYIIGKKPFIKNPNYKGAISDGL